MKYLSKTNFLCASSMYLIRRGTRGFAILDTFQWSFFYSMPLKHTNRDRSTLYYRYAHPSDSSYATGNIFTLYLTICLFERSQTEQVPGWKLKEKDNTRECFRRLKVTRKKGLGRMYREGSESDIFSLFYHLESVSVFLENFLFYDGCQLLGSQNDYIISFLCFNFLLASVSESVCAPKQRKER